MKSRCNNRAREKEKEKEEREGEMKTQEEKFSRTEMST